MKQIKTKADPTRKMTFRNERPVRLSMVPKTLKKKKKVVISQF